MNPALNVFACSGGQEACIPITLIEGTSATRKKTLTGKCIAGAYAELERPPEEVS